MFVNPGFEGLKIVSARKDGGREGVLSVRTGLSQYRIAFEFSSTVVLDNTYSMVVCLLCPGDRVLFLTVGGLALLADCVSQVCSFS